MNPYILLGIAIVTEVIATSALRASNGFSKIGFDVLVVLGYGCSFFLLSLTLKQIPVGIAYAIWSGLGIVLITVVGIVLFRQVPDLPALLGLGLIIAGVVVLQMFSKMSGH
ncbi:MAG: DMT family transporter [Janthinobacterium lividum]